MSNRLPNLIPLLDTGISLTAAWNSREIEAQAGDIIHCGIFIESVNGAPTTASLAAKFQVAPVEFNGFTINAETSAIGVPWIDVVTADTFTGHLLMDGAWPTALADQTYTTRTRIIARRLLVPSLGGLVRVVLTPTFSGGTSPNFKATMTVTVQPGN